jgi:hypothetical protein
MAPATRQQAPSRMGSRCVNTSHVSATPRESSMWNPPVVPAGASARDQPEDTSSPRRTYADAPTRSKNGMQRDH